MKNRFIIIIYCMAAALLTTCVHYTEDLFDRQAAERIAESLHTYRQLLTAQTNGWIVEYYPEKTQRYGGFNLYFRFDGDNVTICSEVDPAASATSTWSLGADMGPSINFDTYNAVLHYFSDPAIAQGGGLGLNYEGDYEFVVESGSENGFILRGKKTKNIICMTPLPANLSWNEYSQSLNEIDQNVIAPAYKMTVGGREISITKKGRNKVFALKWDEEEISAPFIVTPDGIKFYEPVGILGQSLQSFRYHADGDKIISDQNNAEISMLIVPLSNYFIDNLNFTDWYFKTDHIGPGLQSAWNTAKNNLLHYQISNQYYSFRLAFMWLGALSSSYPAGVSIGVWDEEENVVWGGTYVYELEAVNHECVKFNYDANRTSADGVNANLFSRAVSGFTITAFNGKTFTLVPDRDISNPKNVVRIDELILVDVENTDNWVKVSLEETLWP